MDYDEICYIGTRSIDEYEKEYIKKNDILNLGIDVVKYDLDEVLKLVDRFIGNKEVHISFDIDIMDPSLISSTGTPEEGGVNMEEMKKILLFLSKKNVKSMDIVELNPELGDLEETKRNLFQLLDVFIDNRFNFFVNKRIITIRFRRNKKILQLPFLIFLGSEYVLLLFSVLPYSSTSTQELLLKTLLEPLSKSEGLNKLLLLLFTFPFLFFFIFKIYMGDTFSSCILSSCSLSSSHLSFSSRSSYTRSSSYTICWFF